MARKHGFLRAVVAIGAGAAAGYMIYRKRELLRTFFEELTAVPETAAREGTIIEFGPAPEAPEADIVIDRTAAGAEGATASAEEG